MGVKDNKYDEKSCGIVVYRDIKQEDETKQRYYLILKYPGGHFDFPKGHVEEGESEYQTAVRELVEETGIADIRFVDGFREEIDYTYKKKGKLSNKQVVFFLGKTRLEEVVISHEHHDFYWLPFPEAFNKVTFDNAKNLLKKAEAFLNV